MGLRSRVIAYGAALVLVVAGVAGGVGFGGTFGQILAIVLISLGLVLATALVFYEVGLSEDKERAAEQERRSEREQRGTGAHPRPRRRPIRRPRRH
jgi:hypothetical protein